MFQLNRNKQKTNRNSLIESIFWYFYENLELFRVVSKQFYLFRLFRYRFETPKQAEIFVFGFTEQTETKPKQILFRFVLVQTEIVFMFVSRTPYPPLSLLSPTTINEKSK
jgi:hypothetical protein